MAAAIMESLRKPLEVLHQTERERERVIHLPPPPPPPRPPTPPWHSTSHVTHSQDNDTVYLFYFYKN